MIWEIFELNNEGKPSPKEHIKREKVVFPDQEIEVRCRSTAFEENNKRVILVVEYQYMCQDLKHIVRKGFYALWLIPSQSQKWITPVPRINPEDRDIVEERQNLLRQFLEKEN